MSEPERIYLQIYGPKWEDADEVTWCKDIISDDDVEYVRKDIVDDLLAMLKKSRDVIASLDEEHLGIGSADGGYTHWFIRDELLGRIEAALAKAEKKDEPHG